MNYFLYCVLINFWILLLFPVPLWIAKIAVGAEIKKIDVFGCFFVFWCLFTGSLWVCFHG